MSDLSFVLNIPRIHADNAAEIEKQVKVLAGEFFGSIDGLEFPTWYTAEPVSGTGLFVKKAYEVRDLTVKRGGSRQPVSLRRELRLPEVHAANAVEAEAEIDRLVNAFFGSDREVKIYGPEFAALEVSAPEDGGPGNDGKRVYRVKNVVAQQWGPWSTD